MISEYIGDYCLLVFDDIKMLFNVNMIMCFIFVGYG